MKGMCRPLFKVALELRTLVEKSCNETLSERECDRLNELLYGDPEAQSFYLAYMSLHARLSWEFGPRPSVESTSSVPATKSAPARRRSGRRSWAMAGAAVVAATVVACLLLVDWTPEVADRPKPPVKLPVAVDVAEEVATPAPESPVHLAVLSGSADQRWANPGQACEIGQPLVDGRIKLLSGITEVTFANGTVVLLEGPGELEVLTASRGFLHLGKAVVRVPERAKGFILETETVNICDLGTEFAVKVEFPGETEILVLDGAVIAQVKNDDETVAERPMKAGQAVIVATNPEAGLRVYETPFKPERFVRSLPEVEQIVTKAADGGLLDDAVLMLSFDRDTITKDGDTLTFEDISGNGNNGKAVGATWTEDGIRGGACKLDGVDDYIACADAPSLNIKGPMTISMWVNLEAWDNEGGLCTKGFGDGGESWLIDMQGNRIRFVRRPTSVTPYKQVLAKEPATPGKWYHVVAIADGRQLRLYTNMNQSITQDCTKESLVNNRILTIGSRQAHDGPYDASIAGRVDEVAIWPRALSSDEVEQLYRRGKDAAK